MHFTPSLYFRHSPAVVFSNLDANTAVMNESNTSSFIAFKAPKCRVVETMHFPAVAISQDQYVQDGVNVSLMNYKWPIIALA